MRNSGYILLGIATLAGVSFASVNALQPNYEPINNIAVDAVNCVDHDPPSSTDIVNYNGKQYFLIKKSAGIGEDKVRDEMNQVGTTAAGKPMYVAPGNNYFGEPLGDKYVFVDSGTVVKNQRVFDIYLVSGEPIPDFVKNCTSKGGNDQQIDYWRDSQFPPAAFNADEVDNGGGVLEYPGYVYTDNRITLNALQSRDNVQPAGSLFVQSRNASFPLSYHLGTVYLVDGNDAFEYIPTQDPVRFTSEARDNLQLKWFYLVDTPVYSWFTPECKPAIYLYPESAQRTNVIVEPEGEFTLTIPEYPANGGWDIVADPDGTIHAEGETYPYLYYESEIRDDAFTPPTEGYVAAFNELPGLYSSILPKLGLSAKETADFKEYWEQYLPYSPYYFVGIMPVSDIDRIEKLTIDPKPDTTIRVRVYFKALSTREIVNEPNIGATPKREGFVASEWGGMVKLHQGSTFTCSQ